MIRPLANLLYAGRDPTRGWRRDPAKLTVDIPRCRVCDVPVGGEFARLAPLGRSDHAQLAAKGYPEWRAAGVYCIVEHGRIGDITIVLRPSRIFRPFPGQFLKDGVPIALSHATRPEALVEMLGEPFGRSNNDWDDALVLFYEYAAGEAQFAFGHDKGMLDSIEFWYEPELSQKGACDTYGIEKVFPEAMKRTLPK